MSELSNVELKEKEIIIIVVSNIRKMFERRGYEMSDIIANNIISNKNHSFEINGKKFNVNLNFIDVKNISAGSALDDYLHKHNEHSKLIIVKSFQKKTWTQITKEYRNAEIFTFYDFLEDIPAKEIIPQHQLLTETQKNELLECFALNELGKIYSVDIMARYYGAKNNDVFRIVRPNINSGTSIYYRVVVPGNIDIFG